ncbi:MAG: hypothetical protein IPM16_06785 [Chloroflexi bacterium]|nr:hypothetical protein [Chloroflexota bacterium]
MASKVAVRIQELEAQKKQAEAAETTAGDVSDVKAMVATLAEAFDALQNMVLRIAAAVGVEDIGEIPQSGGADTKAKAKK